MRSSLKTAGVLLLLSSFLPAGHLLASEMPSANGFYCQLHYSKIAYSKPVSRVTAHTGVSKQCQSSGDRITWDDIKDRQLAVSSDGVQFQGKVLMIGKTPADDLCTLSPVVQFFVDFEDGSQKIEDVAVMQVNRKFIVSSNRIDDNRDLVVWMNYLASLEDRAIEKVSCFSAWSLGETIVDLTQQVQPALLLR